MLRNYFKIVFRNLVRNKLYSIINIFGLCVGLAVCVVILQYVDFEKSYDRFHSKSEDIYRVILGFKKGDGYLQKDAANFAPAAAALKNDFPEVLQTVRITPEYERTVFSVDELMFQEEKVYYADSTFFDVFDYNWIVGDPKTALIEPGSVVMTMSRAQKYFGPKSQWGESPLNKFVKMNDKEPLKLTGIIEDVPENSHFRFNILLSFTTFLRHNDPTREWGWNDFYTYIVLNPNTDYHVFETKLPAFVKKYKGVAATEQMFLQPLTDIHLNSNIAYEFEANGNAQTVYFLVVIAVMIMVIAWVNYVNLSTARSENRGKEVGVRKVSGAMRNEIIGQMLLEAFFVNLVAIVLMLGVVYAVLPFVGDMLDKPLKFSLLSRLDFLGALFLIYVVGSLLSGIYPALVLSSFKPMDVLKGSSSGIAKSKSSLRQALVVFQFIMSAGLVTCTIVIQYQLEFVRSQKLGFDHDNLLIINSPSTISDERAFLNDFQFFKKELSNFPEVERVSITSALPGKASNDLDMNGPIKMVGQSDDNSNSFAVYRVDLDFFDVMGIQMIAGRNFVNELSIAQLIGDSTDISVVVNRKGAQLLGYNNPADIIGKTLSFDGKPKEVIGVFENYHHKSLKNAIEPMIVRNRVSGVRYITIRMAESANLNVKNVVQKIQREWNQVYGESPFVYSFLSEHVAEQYKDDDRFNKIFTQFAIISILIACLGLFGLVSYSVNVRVKEVGIRKVLGASSSNIVLLFFKDYFKLIAVSLMIGIPFSAYVIGMWLENFVFRATLQWWLFILPAVVVTILAFITISGQVVKAAVSDPSKTLKNQ